jgi:hypothetical protein
MLLPKEEECIESSPPLFCVSALFIRFRSTLLHVVATRNIDAAQVLPVSDIQTPGLEKKALLRSLGPCPNQWNILFGFMHIRGLQPVVPFIGEGGPVHPSRRIHASSSYLVEARAEVPLARPLVGPIGIPARDYLSRWRWRKVSTTKRLSDLVADYR